MSFVALFHSGLTARMNFYLKEGRGVYFYSSRRKAYVLARRKILLDYEVRLGS